MGFSCFILFLILIFAEEKYKQLVLMEYQEIKTNKVRNVISFSFCFLTFFGGEIYFNKEFCGFVTIRQEKIKYRTTYFNEFYYQEEYKPWKYRWKTIKIE